MSTHELQNCHINKKLIFKQMEGFIPTSKSCIAQHVKPSANPDLIASKSDKDRYLWAAFVYSVGHTGKRGDSRRSEHLL